MISSFLDLFRTPEERALEAFKRRLNEWDSRAVGQIEQERHQAAADRMLEAYIEKETFLDFYGLDLKNMPPGFDALTHLKDLDLEFNNLNPFPPLIEKMINLQILKMGANRLPAIPPWIGKMTNIIELSLDGNWLTVLPTEIGMLTNMKILKLHKNRLTALPTEIGNLRNLEELSLFQNQLENLTPEIEKLVKLQTLNIDDNKFVFPPEITTLTNLKEFTLDNNKFQYLSPKIERQAKLEELSLSGNKLTTLPSEIGTLTKLQRLSLTGNKFIVLLPEIGKLTNLQHLFLDKNKFKFLPPVIVHLTNLKSLGLEENGLTLLSSNIGILTKLEYLGLDKNKLTALPTEIGKLTKLEKLHVYNNQLTALPSEIGNLLRLKELYLAKNRLTDLPSEIGNLINLKELHLHSNPNLQSLPLTLGNCSQIVNLDVEGCPLVLARQRSAILARTEALRRAGGVLMLPVRLATWKAYGGFDGDLPFLNFTTEQQCQIGEFLLRLERCKDFQRKRGELARLVCKILADLRNSPAFKEAFFAKIAGNLEDCSDRTSMLLNMIYTDWKLYVESPGATDQQKLELLAGLAKTLTFRETLEQMVLAYEAKNKTTLHESVEYFLYYEILYKKELGLITAIDNMCHPEIGKASHVIDEQALIKAVKENSFDTLCNFDALEKMLEKFPDYTKERADIESRAQHELAQVEEKKLKDQEHLKAVKVVTDQRSKKLADLKKKLLSGKIF